MLYNEFSVELNLKVETLLNSLFSIFFVSISTLRLLL